MTEFELITEYFSRQITHRPDVEIGIGDDAAVITIPEKHALVVTTDSLVAGVHFPIETIPFDIGYKSLAVNLSDLAAMGATPAWVTMALTLPEENQAWLEEFSNGFFTLANRHSVQLIGGDLTHGPLSITIQALGLVPDHQAITRSKAKPGDLIYVTGTLGDAGLALKYPDSQRDILEKLHRPEPRVATGIALRSFANAAIDISDGFAADLNHILEASHVGARIIVDELPLSEALTHRLSTEQAITMALTAGDDYELCFTVPADKHDALEKQLSSIPCRYTCVGEITDSLKLELCYQNGNNYHGPINGYQHF